MKTGKRIFLFLNMIIFAAMLSGCSSMLDEPGNAPDINIKSRTGGYSVAEAGGTLDLYITLNREPEADVTFTLTSSDTTEGTVSAASMTFTPSDWDEPQTLTVSGVDEFFTDGNKNISLAFGPVVSTDAGYTGFVKPSLGIVVIDNETDSVVVSPTSGLTTTEAGGTQTFTVVLSSQPTDDVTITVSSSDSSEGTADTALLTFTGADFNIPQTVTVTGQDDIIYDRDINYTIQLGNAVCTDPHYSSMVVADVSVTNTDDELPAVVVTPTTLNLAEGTPGTFTVVLGNIPVGNVTIPVSTTDTVRSSVSTSLLTFTPGNYNVPQTVTVTAVSNGLDDGNTTATVVLGLATGYNNENPDDVTVNITDDDAFEIRFGSLSRHTTEGGQNATFTVKLGSEPASDVIVNLDETADAANSGNAEGTINIDTLTFTSANWNDPQTVTVTGVNDDYADGNKVYLIYATTATADPDYQGVTNNIAVTNDDNDSYGLQVVANGSTTNITNGAVTFTGFATDDMGNLGTNYANWTVRLRSKPTANVVITLTSNSVNSDGVIRVDGVPSATLTFTPLNWSTTQSVTVIGASGGTNEGGHDYTISSSIASSDSKYGSVTYVKPPSFTIFSSDNDVSNKIAYCRKSGGFSTSENLGTATFWLLSKSAPSSDENVPVSITDVYSYLPSQVIATVVTPGTGTAVITSSNYNILGAAESNKVVVRGEDDDENPYGGTYYTVLIGLSSSTLNYDAPDVSILNSDNDQVILAGNASGNTGENGTTATFGVKLKIAPASGKTVSFTVSSGTTSEGTFTSRTLTFNDSNWNTWQSFTVTGVDDHKADGTQGISMLYSIVTSDDERLDGYPSGNLGTGISNLDNDKLIWVTGTEYLGNMGSGVVQADIAVNTITDANYPSLMPGGTTYKALIVDGSTRVARTTPTGNTGQLNWVLQPNTEYYLKTGSYPYTTRIFTTDGNGIPGAFAVGFSTSSSDHFWTGLNTDWTTSSDTCGLWMLDNQQGRYGAGNSTGTDAISSGSAVSNGPVKKIIGVQE